MIFEEFSKILKETNNKILDLTVATFICLEVNPSCFISESMNYHFHIWIQFQLLVYQRHLFNNYIYFNVFWDVFTDIRMKMKTFYIFWREDVVDVLECMYSKTILEIKGGLKFLYQLI